MRRIGRPSASSPGTSRSSRPTLILRSLALNHFYRFVVQRAIKQRVCDKLGIKIKAVNLLEQERLRS